MKRRTRQPQRRGASGFAADTEQMLQEQCRSRGARKLPTALAADGFRFPSTLALEQATSEVVARYHASLIPEGASVLDLTCGLGIDAFAMARRGARVTAVEIDAHKADCARHNARVLGLENVTVLTDDACRMVADTPADSYDVIFIDPARRDAAGRRIYTISDCAPDVTALLPRMLEIAPVVMIKASPMLDITHTIRTLGAPVASVQAVGTTAECSELLIICRRGNTSAAQVAAVTLVVPERPAADAPVTPATYLYEPWPTQMKIADFGSLTTQFGVEKISTPTHLFTADDYKPDFPGNIYRIDRTFTFSKADIKALRIDCAQGAMIATRGASIAAEELRSRLKIADSSSRKIFAVQNHEGRRLLIVTTPLR